MRGDQLGRQWKLLQILFKRRQGARAEELAAALDTPKRNVYRDLEALQAGGFPLFNDPAGRESYWKVTDTFRQTTPVPFAPQELMALEVARKLLKPLTGTVFQDAIEAAFAKIRATLTDGVVEFLDRYRGHFSTAAGPFHDYSQLAKEVQTLHAGLNQQRAVSFAYHAFSTGEDARRTVDPYGLYHHAGTLYLVAHCHLRSELRLFTVDRVHDANLTDQHFECPPDFDLQAFMASAFGAFVGDAEQVSLRFAPGAARYVRERIWHPSQTITDTPDGGCELAFEIPVSGEIEAWILSWAGDCEVLSPPRLRKRIQERHQRGFNRNS